MPHPPLRFDVSSFLSFHPSRTPSVLRDPPVSRHSFERLKQEQVRQNHILVNFRTLTPFPANTAAKGLIGGAASEAGGGDFVDGLVGSVAGSLGAGIAGGAPGGIIGRTLTAAAIGGTAAALTGGSFANGAISAAFSHLFGREGGRLNALAHDVAARLFGTVGDWRRIISSYFSGDTIDGMPRYIAEARDALINGPDYPDGDIAGALNGHHPWHAGTNTMITQKVGLLGLPLLIAGGIYHETPFDPTWWTVEQVNQGTVNHLLDSAGDLVANTYGQILGLFGPRDYSTIKFAMRSGNYIIGPSDSDKGVAGGTGGTYRQAGSNPLNGWGKGKLGL